jgi:ABC-type lipopolysaccharide export system ATPase subunit
MSELRTESLKKTYRARTVVQDASLHVSSGEVVGLLGPNGAGKTTTFYMIVGLVAADGGERSTASAGRSCISNSCANTCCANSRVAARTR